MNNPRFATYDAQQQQSWPMTRRRVGFFNISTQLISSTGSPPPSAFSSDNNKRKWLAQYESMEDLRAPLPGVPAVSLWRQQYSRELRGRQVMVLGEDEYGQDTWDEMEEDVIIIRRGAQPPLSNPHPLPFSSSTAQPVTPAVAPAYQEVHIIWGGIAGGKPPPPGVQSPLSIELVRTSCPYAQIVCGEASEALTSKRLILDVAGRWSESRVRGVAMRWVGAATLYLYLADEHFKGCSGALGPWEASALSSFEFTRLHRSKDSPYSDAFLAWAQTVFKVVVPAHDADRERLSAKRSPPSRFSPPPTLPSLASESPTPSACASPISQDDDDDDLRGMHFS